MDFLQIENEMEHAVSCYGSNGDDSLEYYGLVIKNGSCNSSKIYRRASMKSREEEIIGNYKNLDFFKSVIRYAKIYDFSTRTDAAGRAYMRMVFAPFKEVMLCREEFAALIQLCRLDDYAWYFEKLIEYYKYRSFTGTSPLLKMGVELSDFGEVIEAKAYFALKSFDDIYDSIGKRYRYSSCKYLVEKSLSLLGMKNQAQQFEKIGEELEAIDYFPIFTGVNFSKNSVEMKVYYETCFKNYTRDTILHGENILAGMMLKHAEPLTCIHERMIDKGVFLDCVSYSVIKTSDQVTEKDIWKPYYLILDETLIRSRMMDRYFFDEQNQKSGVFDQYKQVLLVDQFDTPTGFMNKTQAHAIGARHRAFSVFIHDGKGNMLIQRRAATKYHSPSLLTNACCSHPLTQYVEQEAEIRLGEELGIVGAKLTELFVLPYCAEVGLGLIENEVDHVLEGVYSGEVTVNPEEAEESYFIPFDDLLDRVHKTPEEFTVWFRMAIDRVIGIIQQRADE